MPPLEGTPAENAAWERLCAAIERRNTGAGNHAEVERLRVAFTAACEQPAEVRIGMLVVDAAALDAAVEAFIRAAEATTINGAKLEPRQGNPRAALLGALSAWFAEPVQPSDTRWAA